MTRDAQHQRPSTVLVWLGLRPSPLRRASDRVEILSRWVAVVVALVGLSMSAMVGNAVDKGLAADAESAGLSPATATLARDASVYPPLGMEPSVRSKTPATWTSPDGATMHGLVTTTATAQEGDRVGVFLRPDGTVAPAPPSTFERTALSTAAGLTAPVLALVLGWLWLALVRYALRSRRAQYWDVAWSAFDQSGSHPSP